MTAGQLHNQMIKDGSKPVIETLQLIDENRVTLSYNLKKIILKMLQNQKRIFKN